MNNISVHILTPFLLLLATASFADEPARPIKRVDVSNERRAELEAAAFETVSSPDVDQFVLSDTVKFSTLPRIGAEFNINADVAPWNASQQINAWTPGFAFEPYSFQYYFQFKKGDAGPDFMDDTGGGAGATSWGLFQNGFYDGADIWFFRREGTRMNCVRQTRIKQYQTFPDEVSADGNQRPNHARLTFEDEGPVPKPGDWYVIRKTFTKLPDNIREFNEKYKWAGFMKGWLNSAGGFNVSPGTEFEFDTTTFAPEGGSTASLKLELTGKGSAGIDSYYISDYTQAWKNPLRFEPDVAYCGQIWLRQQDMPSGKVTVQIGSYLTETVTVKDEWTKFEFDIPANKPLPPNTMNSIKVTSSEKGTLWIDNFLVWQTDTPQFAILPRYINALKEFKPRTLRNHHYLLLDTYCLDALVKRGFSEPTVWSPKGSGGPIRGYGLGLGGYLTACKEIGADPWFNIHFWPKEQVDGLMEYLGGPADSKYGKLRIEDGQKEPWTGVFSNICIEVGNEVWGSLFMPMPVDDYIALCNTTFATIKASPYYTPSIRCMGGGQSAISASSLAYPNSVWDYKVLKNLDQMDAFAWGAFYIGGWDGVTLPGQSDTKFLQLQLLNPTIFLEEKIDTAIAMRKMAGRETIPLGMYEFGPGYSMPSAAQPYKNESENIGKSLALGVATLDSIMLSLNRGLTGIQSFYTFGAGYNFTSHNNVTNFYPIPAWIALEMYNNRCAGDLLETEAKAVSTINIPEMLTVKETWDGKITEGIIEGKKNVQMVRCYSFRRADGTYAALVYNLWVDQSRTVELKLPVAPAPQAALYKLTADDPRANNRFDYNVKMQTEKVSGLSQTYRFTLPASSVYILEYRPAR